METAHRDPALRAPAGRAPTLAGPSQPSAAVDRQHRGLPAPRRAGSAPVILSIAAGGVADRGGLAGGQVGGAGSQIGVRALRRWPRLVRATAVLRRGATSARGSARLTCGPVRTGAPWP